MGEIGEYWRDARKRRRGASGEQHASKHQKRGNPTPQKNPPHRRCYDWIITTGSSRSYAKNRSWFSDDYRRVDMTTSSGIKIIGTGTVHLKAKRAPKSDEISTLELRHVLHVPDAKCNGFNPLVGDRCSSGLEWIQSKFVGTDVNHAPVWYSERFCGLARLVLPDPKEGESPLTELKAKDPDYVLWMSIYLTEEEDESLFPDDLKGESPLTEFKAQDPDCVLMSSIYDTEEEDESLFPDDLDAESELDSEPGTDDSEPGLTTAIYRAMYGTVDGS